MRVLSVIGTTQTGKTTTIENIIKELKKRRYSVGSVKEIHFEEFAIDTEGSNTDRHKKAGSELVSARGYYETDILFQEKISMDKLLRFYDHDFVILEGVTDANVPRIIAGIEESDVDDKFDDLAFCISGVISNDESKKEYRGLPIINSVDDINKLADFIEEKVYYRLPDFPVECCGECGYSCRELGSKILKGEAKREDCVIIDTKVKLKVDGNEIKIVPFVQDILRNAVLGVVKELEGYKKGKKIEVTIDE